MLAGFADGNVCILALGMAPRLYWVAVTPNGGEVVELE
jgi:hypothetical protein